jgi:hypothetical protein
MDRQVVRVGRTTISLTSTSSGCAPKLRALIEHVQRRG